MADKFKETIERMSKNMPKGGLPKPGGGAAAAAANAITALATAGVLGFAGYNSVYTVDGGHRAVVFNRISGMEEKVRGEGLNFVVPWFQRPYIYDVRTRPCNLQTLTGSKDLQMVTIGVRLLHKPNPNHLVWIYQHLGMNYDERVLPSLMNECAKAVVARYNANELLTLREQVSADIRAELLQRASQFNVILEDVAITHLSFSPEYARAVEAKQVGK
jgi:regulator of protease activity HflC (stomatin/prohibitin superfamily)